MACELKYRRIHKLTSDVNAHLGQPKRGKILNFKFRGVFHCRSMRGYYISMKTVLTVLIGENTRANREILTVGAKIFSMMHILANPKDKKR